MYGLSRSVYSFLSCVPFHLFSSPEPKAYGELIVWYSSLFRPSVFPHFQRSSLKPLGQSKPIFYEASIGGTNVYITNPGHVTKMATMTIYGMVKHL